MHPVWAFKKAISTDIMPFNHDITRKFNENQIFKFQFKLKIVVYNFGDLNGTGQNY